MVNANAVTRHYAVLTPEERFRLILAASGRGDEAERGRLVNAGKRITLVTQDHAPYARAFEELALLVFIELLEDAACYLEWLDRADDPLASDDRDEAGEASGGAEGGEVAEGATGGRTHGRQGKPAWARRLELAYAAGFVLRTKAEGWRLYCERMAVPHQLLWEGFPGLDRLRRALEVAAVAAFAAEGFLRWLNEVRREGDKVLVEMPLTAEGVADATEKMFRQLVKCWGG